MKVLIIGSSKLPIPATKGGAVPNLIEELIQENEIHENVNLYCCSLWEEQAEKQAKKYKSTQFIWAKVPKIVLMLDKCFYFILKNIFHMERLLSLGFLFQVIWYTFFIANLLHKEHFDKIIFENSVPVLFSLKLYKNNIKYKNKYYIHMHSVPKKYYGNLKIFTECKKLICVSEYVANEILKNKDINLEKDKIYIMYNCLDTTCIKPLSIGYDTIKQKYNIPKDKKIILFVGRLCKEKGIEEVLKAMIELKDKNFILLIVGANFYNSGITSPYEKKIKELAKIIKNEVYFTGYVDYKDIAYIYNLADIIILPSMWEEPAGMTIIEAMACKKPVITTKSGGIPEYTGNNNCILLERDEEIVKNIVFYIKKLSNESEFTKNLCKKSYNRAVLYDKSFYYQQFLELLGD